MSHQMNYFLLYNHNAENVVPPESYNLTLEFSTCTQRCQETVSQGKTYIGHGWVWIRVFHVKIHCISVASIKEITLKFAVCQGLKVPSPLGSIVFQVSFRYFPEIRYFVSLSFFSVFSRKIEISGKHRGKKKNRENTEKKLRNN